jgi:ATP-binding cassette subfamily F protein 3
VEAPAPQQKPKIEKTERPDNNASQLSKLNKQLATVEATITELQSKKEEIEKQLADSALYTNPSKSVEVQQAYDLAKSQLETANAKWEKIASEIDALSQA